jgi:hypothetical protein
MLHNSNSFQLRQAKLGAKLVLLPPQSGTGQAGLVVALNDLVFAAVVKLLLVGRILGSKVIVIAAVFIVGCNFVLGVVRRVVVFVCERG